MRDRREATPWGSTPPGRRRVREHLLEEQRTRAEVPEVRHPDDTEEKPDEETG